MRAHASLRVLFKRELQQRRIWATHGAGGHVGRDGGHVGRADSHIGRAGRPCW